MNRDKKLLKKRVLITGAATGIGRTTALELAKEGAEIAINFYPTDDQEMKAHEVAQQICQELKEIGCEALLLPADISKEDEVVNMFKEVRERWNGLDVLINNAGIQRKVQSHELTLDLFMKVVGTDFIGTFLCSREALKLFLEKNIKGTIINNSSVHQLIPKPGYLSYSMSKGGVMNLTKTLALEYAHKGIRVNSVAPGAIITPINPWAKDPEKLKRVASHIPLQEVGKAEQIAKAMLFLASSDSDYMTGQTLFVDGGLTLYPDFGEDWSSS